MNCNLFYFVIKSHIPILNWTKLEYKICNNPFNLIDLNFSICTFVQLNGRFSLFDSISVTIQVLFLRISFLIQAFIHLVFKLIVFRSRLQLQKSFAWSFSLLNALLPEWICFFLTRYAFSLDTLFFTEYNSS